MPGIRWKKLSCSGDLPEPRWGHTSSQSGSTIIVFGGTGSKLFNDCYFYDTGTYIFKQLHAIFLSSLSSFLSFFLIYLFLIHSNFLCMYVTVNNSWSQPDGRGGIPAPRLGHSTTTLPDGKLLVFGGRGQNKHYSDMHPYHPLPLSPFPFPFSYHSHTILLSFSFFLFLSLFHTFHSHFIFHICTICFLFILSILFAFFAFVNSLTCYAYAFNSYEIL